MGNKRVMMEERGITLMALIITIIILIILAVITIGTVYTSGIIQMGVQGAKDYAVATSKENEILEETTSYVEDVVKNIRKRLGQWDYFEEKGTVDGTPGNSNNPTIPKGFRPVNTDNSNWGNGEQAPSAKAVDNGLVIEDEDGNQFVWVPCYVSSPSVVDAQYPEYKQHEYVGGEEDSNYGGVDDNGWGSFYYRDSISKWGDSAASEYGNESVTEFGGFWIGRYEAGIPENASFYPTKEVGGYNSTVETKNASTEGDTKLKPVSKGGYFSWNFIDQPTAVAVSNNMYEGREDVESHLIDSYAWDTVMRWFETSEKDRSYVTDSTTKGNYVDHTGSYTGKYAEHICSSFSRAPVSGWLYAARYKEGTTFYGSEEKDQDYVSSEDFTQNSQFMGSDYSYYSYLEIPTGADDTFAVKNIYDMGGNMAEWTTESRCSVSVIRQMQFCAGGAFTRTSGYTGLGSWSTNQACFRNGFEFENLNDVNVGFRVVLYVK